MKAYRADVAFDGERFLPAGVLVVVDDGVIVGVEPGGATIPQDLDVTYMPGTSLLPGLVDTHTHLCADAGPVALDRFGDLSPTELGRIVGVCLRRQVSAGVTTVRDLGDRAWFVAEHRAARPGLPRVLASGPALTPVGGHGAVMGGEIPGLFGSRALALRAAVQERAERRVDVVKIMGSGGVMTPGTDPAAAQFDLAELRAVVQTAHARGLPVTVHAHALAAVRDALTAGADGIEHCSCLTPAGPWLPPDLLADLAASQVAVCPTAGRLGIEPPAPVKQLLQRLRLTGEDRRRHFGAMHRAGVRLVGGDDSGIHPAKPHGIMPLAVAEFLDYGATIAQALAGSTSIAADAIGLTAVTGRLRAGLAADLLLVPGDLRHTVTPLQTPSTVIIRGHPAPISHYPPPA